MDRKIHISVIVATLNSSATIRDAITGLNNQAYKNFEVIFVDGGSSDDTLDLIAMYCEFNYAIVHQQGQGIASAWNQGLCAANGNVFTFLNSDDYYDREILTVVAQEFDRRANGATVLFGDVEVVSENNSKLIFKKFGKAPSYLNLLNGFQFLHPSVFFNRNCLDLVGVFNSQFRIGCDADWLIRCFVNDVSFVKVPIVVQMRDGGVSRRLYWVGCGEFLQSLDNHGFSKLFLASFLLCRFFGLMVRYVKG